MPYEPPPELAGLSLAQIAELTAARKLPPVDQWDPQASSNSLMQIKADGRFDESPLVRMGRLSVVPLTDDQYAALLELSGM